MCKLYSDFMESQRGEGGEKSLTMVDRHTKKQAYTLEKVKYISSGSRIFTLACLGPRYFCVSERVLYQVRNMKRRTFYNLCSQENQEFKRSVAEYANISKFARADADFNAVATDVWDTTSESSFCRQESSECATDAENTFDSFPSELSTAEKFYYIKSWAMRHNITQEALNDLVRTLLIIGVKNLPLSAQTILETPKNSVEVQNILGGEFAYYGIQSYFESRLFPSLKNATQVLIDVGIDGLKPFESTKRVLWPILGSIVGNAIERPFLIACFSGKQKPTNANGFLKDFAEEVSLLRTNGLKVGSFPDLKRFDVHLFICDSPARAFISGVQGHSGKHSCPKCCQVGERIGTRLSFSKQICELRTDLSFKNRLDKEHHNLQQQSVLEAANFRMVSQFPLDPMHLVDLGVTKGNIAEMNTRFDYISSYVPSEFGRVCRNLEENKNWKSTEYRQFLLYSGIFVLKGCVDDNLYYHFLLLHASIRILSCGTFCETETNVVQEMLDEFVNLFGEIYGDDLISFNIHCLLHLPACARDNGTLDQFSAYKFENFMQFLKKLIKKPNQILQQLYFRLQERKCLEIKKTSKYGSLIIDPKKEKDSYFFSKGTGPIKIIETINESGKDVVVANAFLKVDNYYEAPLESLSALGILVGSRLDEMRLEISWEDIEHKYFCIPFENKYLLIPLLHNLFHKFSN
ncbi:uncharacterized protein [Eurosta solidaginis]|uniref:uncharacterized protein isoform X4 n=1 Tax=Eurosta solidaginis TaxID=178769 RepID=UPI0035307F77